MKKTRILSLIFVIIMSMALLVGCGGNNGEAGGNDNTTGPSTSAEPSASAEPDKVYTIKMVTADSPSTIWCELLQKAAENIKARTNGGVDIQFHPNGEMLVYDEGIEAVMSDTAVIYFTDPSLFVDYAPAFETICAPYLWTGYEEVEAFLETDLYADLAAEAEANNLHAIANGCVVGVRHVLADRPITTVEDLAGLKIRVPASQIYVNTFEALGTDYQGLPFSEVYNALETGMITAVELTPGTIITMSPQESMSGDKYYSLNNHMVNIAGLWCGQGYWNSLPGEYQSIMTEEFQNAFFESNRQVADGDADIIASLPDLGIEVVEVDDLSSFEAAVAEMNSKMARWDEISAKVLEIRRELDK